MTATKKIKQILTQEKPVIQTKYGVKKIGLFGSYIHNKQTPQSDIDLLVEFQKPISFFTFLDLESYLESKLNHKIDLVTPNALKPAIGQQILNEVTYL